MHFNQESGSLVTLFKVTRSSFSETSEELGMVNLGNVSKIQEAGIKILPLSWTLAGCVCIMCLMVTQPSLWKLGRVKPRLPVRQLGHPESSTASPWKPLDWQGEEFTGLCYLRRASEWNSASNSVLILRIGGRSLQISWASWGKSWSWRRGRGRA